MEISPQEPDAQSTGIVARVRDAMWKRIEHEHTSQQTQAAWAELVRAVAERLDGPKLTKVKAYLEQNVDLIGKQAAIEGRVADVVLSLASVGAGIGVAASSGTSDAMMDAQREHVFVKGLNDVQKKKELKALAKGAALVGGGGVTIFVHPADRLMFYSAKWGKGLAARVAGGVNAIVGHGQTASV